MDTFTNLFTRIAFDATPRQLMARALAAYLTQHRGEPSEDPETRLADALVDLRIGMAAAADDLGIAPSELPLPRFKRGIVAAGGLMVASRAHRYASEALQASEGGALWYGLRLAAEIASTASAAADTHRQIARLHNAQAHTFAAARELPAAAHDLAFQLHQLAAENLLTLATHHADLVGTRRPAAHQRVLHQTAGAHHLAAHYTLGRLADCYTDSQITWKD